MFVSEFIAGNEWNDDYEVRILPDGKWEKFLSRSTVADRFGDYSIVRWEISIGIAYGDYYPVIELNIE